MFGKREQSQTRGLTNRNNPRHLSLDKRLCKHMLLYYVSHGSRVLTKEICCADRITVSRPHYTAYYYEDTQQIKTILLMN